MAQLTKNHHYLTLLNAVPKGEDFAISANQTGVYGVDGTVYYNDQGRVNYGFDSMQDFIDFFVYGKDVERTESYYVGDRADDGQITWFGENYSLDMLDPDEDGSCVYLKPVRVGGNAPEAATRHIEIKLLAKDSEQEVFIHKGSRSFEIRVFANGGCRLQIFNGSIGGENVIYHRVVADEQEALTVLKEKLELDLKLLR
jgi:hypothetical protein